MVNPQALEEFHRGLAEEVREIKAALPNFYYYIANHAKDPVTGKTAHTTSRYPKRLYEDRVEGVSVAEWLKAAVMDKQYRDVGSELL
jgi:phosphopentomutase